MTGFSIYIGRIKGVAVLNRLFDSALTKGSDSTEPESQLSDSKTCQPQVLPPHYENPTGFLTWRPLADSMSQVQPRDTGWIWETAGGGDHINRERGNLLTILDQSILTPDTML